MVKLVWYFRKICSWTSTKKEVEGGKLGRRMGCGSVLSKKLMHSLAPIFAFKMCCLDRLHKGLLKDSACAPLSDFITLGHPNCEITLSRTGITVEAEIDLTISTTGYRQLKTCLHRLPLAISLA